MYRSLLALASKIHWVLASLAIAATVAGCGSPSADSGLATLSDSEQSPSDQGDSAAPVETDPEQALLALAECIRENGIPEFPDPVVDSDGVARIDFQALAGAGIEPGSPEVERAVEECGDLVEGVTQGGGPLSGADTAEIEDSLLAFADCMRDEGLTDFPDPDMGDIAGGGPFGGNAIDLDDPRTAAAVDVCRDEFNLPGSAGSNGGE
jgi:hypothetical protein